jgi:hypothetical protein
MGELPVESSDSQSLAVIVGGPTWNTAPSDPVRHPLAPFRRTPHCGVQEEHTAMIEDEREERLRPDAPRFDVAPVRRGRGIPILVTVGIVVGIAAFVGGLAVASPGPSAIPRGAVERPTTPGRPTNVPAATVAQPAINPDSTFPPAAARPTPAAARPSQAIAPPSPTAPPGSSAFIGAFHPAVIVRSLAQGDRCTGADPLENDVPRTRADGPRLTFQRSWLLYCRIPEEQRQSFLVDLFAALEGVIPADTYGYRSTLRGAGSALYPYAERPMAGTVAVHADAAGEGLAVVIVVEEWRTD